MDAPELDYIQIRAKEWFTRVEVIESALEVGGRVAYLQAACDKWLIPKAWEQDVLQIRQALATYGPKWWRFLSSSYRQAQNRLKSLCRDKLPEKVSSQLKLVDAILEVQRLEPVLGQNEPLLKRLFRTHWQGKQTDWKYLSNVAAWLISLYQDIQSGLVPYEVAYQIGSAGFFVDLAVVDKERPGRYLLGIECDGATYHSARSARDRDRLRQQVLENLGWRIHRIWSTDWFRNPGAELRRAVKAIEAVRSVATNEPLSTVSQSVSHNPVERHGTKPLRNPVQAERYKMASLRIPQFQFSGVELHEVPRQEIAGWVKQVVEVESPVRCR